MATYHLRHGPNISKYHNKGYNPYNEEALAYQVSIQICSVM